MRWRCIREKAMTAEPTIQNETIAWLLAGDPAVAWQAERNLLSLEGRSWQVTRERVATEG
jgi:hypothetical protein